MGVVSASTASTLVVAVTLVASITTVSTSTNTILDTSGRLACATSTRPTTSTSAPWSTLTASGPSCPSRPVPSTRRRRARPRERFQLLTSPGGLLQGARQGPPPCPASDRQGQVLQQEC